MAVPMISLEEIAALPRGARLMGLDLGTKTIGLAISDVDRRIASPLETIRRTKFTADAEALLHLAEKHGVAVLVIGLPLNMDGSEGPRVQATKAFSRNLAQKTTLPQFFWDERLSTAAVTRTLLEADTSRARRDALVDKLAAAYILQGVIDRVSHLASSLQQDDDDGYA
jgi:putative Holliday junction resolvase